MSHFSLRPVTDKDGSRSPTGSTSTASSHTPPPLPMMQRDAKQLPGLPTPQLIPATARPRRPLSPSSLRDVDLSRDVNAPARKWPAPPTGHELMALFPPPPPVSVLTGPTSDYFQREERAFFAKAGKEIVRVRIEVDVPRDGEAEPVGKARVPRQWQPTTPNPQAQSPTQASPADRTPASPYTPRLDGPRMQRGPVTVTTQPLFPINSHPSPPQPPFPPNAAPVTQHPAVLRTPSHEHARLPPGGNPSEPMPEEYREDMDESWRHPMPHNQRRRAGKHTKRVVVKT